MKVETLKSENNVSYQVIKPDSRLKKKATAPSLKTGTALEAIQRAEDALKDLSVNFDDWMDREVEKLCAAQDAAIEKSFDDESVEALFAVSHDIKGQASILGYPLAEDVCKSLCDLIENLPEKQRLSVVLIEQHINTVCAIVRANISSSDDPKTLKLIRSLTKMVAHFTGGELSRQIK